MTSSAGLSASAKVFLPPLSTLTTSSFAATASASIANKPPGSASRSSQSVPSFLAFSSTSFATMASTPVTLLPIAALRASEVDLLAPLEVPPLVQGDIFVDTTKSLRETLRVNSESAKELRGVFRKPAVVGHRGALYDELENTRESFLHCATALGCDAVELDVFLLKDGNLIVFHGGGTDENPGDLSDYCLDMENGENILDLTYEESLNLRFNPNFEEFPCSPSKIASASIPTLEQVLLDLKPTGCHVKIELKGPGTLVPSLELVERLDMVNQCSFSSFDHGRLRQLRDMRPDKAEDGSYIYKTGALFDDVPDDYIQRAVACGATEIHLRYDTCTFDRISEIHGRGLGSMAWFRGPVGMRSDCANKYLDVGNEDRDCYQAMIDTGVQQICCNRPGLAMNMIKGAAVTL